MSLKGLFASGPPDQEQAALCHSCPKEATTDGDTPDPFRIDVGVKRCRRGNRIDLNQLETEVGPIWPHHRKAFLRRRPWLRRSDESSVDDDHRRRVDAALC
jgi:hypothetical protein